MMINFKLDMTGFFFFFFTEYGSLHQLFFTARDSFISALIFGLLTASLAESNDEILMETFCIYGI